jgi:hypothetical protein
MRRIVLVAVCIAANLFAINALYAQRGIQLGLRAMPTSIWMLNQDDSDSSTEYRFTAGMSAGLMAGYGLNDNMSIVANFLYASTGQNLLTDVYTEADATTGDLREIEVKTERRLRYFQLPVFFKYSSNAERKVAVFGMLGPQLGILLSARDENNDRRYTPEFPPYSQVANFPEPIDRYQRIDLQAVGAVGIDVKLRFNLKMNLQARFGYSLLDVENKDRTYDIRTNGVVQEVNYWGEDRAVTRNLFGGLMLGFTYVFIPKFHY